MNQIEIFNSPEFGSIRTLEQNGKVLFCGTDVATALGYTNPRKAVRDHTRGGTKCSIGVQTGKKADGSPAVQMVEMLFIPEGDLYRLIAHSKLRQRNGLNNGCLMKFYLPFASTEPISQKRSCGR